MRALKIIVLLIAIAGVAAIGWYLLNKGEVQDQVRIDSPAVKVEQPAASSGSVAATETRTEEAPAATASEDRNAAAVQPVAQMIAKDLAGLGAEEVEARYNAVHEVERTAFITDFVRAAGEDQAIEIARAHMGGPAEGRNYDLANDIVRIAVVEFQSRIGSYLAGILAFRGDGTARDLDAAMRYLKHEGLDETSSAIYWRGMVLLDPEYSGHDRAAGIDLMHRAIAVGAPNENGVILARQKLEELGLN